jgi:hypothetical protein
MLSPGGKVFRGTVINSNRLSGEVVVQLGGFGVSNNYITISHIGRSPINGRWKVPEPGNQVYVTADDDSLSNPTLLEVWTADPEGATGDPIGHEDKLKSQVAFDNSTRIFTIFPVAGEHIVWCRGQRFSKRVVEGVQLPNTTGVYFIYYDLNGVLSSKPGVIVNWGTDTPVAYVYWNASTGEAEFIADERHGITLDWQTHEYLHRTRGSAYANGFGAYGFVLDANGTAAVNSDAQMGLLGGTFFDEDLQVDITHSESPAPLSWQQHLSTPAQIPAFYRLSTGWRGDAATTYPLKQGTTLPVYNVPATWTTVDIGNGKFGITWVVATNGLNPPIIGILGQAEYNNIGEAESANWSSLDLTGLPIVELRPLYKVVYQVGNNYTNTPKAVLRGVYDLRISYSSFGTAPAVQTVDHGSLTGLADDDHPQYLDTTRGDARYLQLTGGTVSGSLTASSGVTTPNTTNVGLQNVAGTSYFHLDRGVSGNAQWKTKAGVGAFIDADTVNVRTSAGSAIGVFNSTGLAVTGNASTTGDVAINGGDITTTATTFNLVDTTVTTLNLARAATTLNIGATTGTTAVRNSATVAGTLSADGTVSITSAGNSTSSLVNNAGALEVRGGTNVVLYPAATGRIVTGRGKNTLQMTGFTNLIPTADVTLSNSSTDMINGISVTSMEAGDVLDIRAVLRMQRTTVTTSSLTIVVNVAGPSGNTNLPGRLIYADGTVTHDLDHTHTGQWLYTCALGAGTYTVKVSGYGYDANVWKMLVTDNDSVLSVATYSMR